MRCLLLVFALWFSSVAKAELLVVVGEHSPIDKLTQKEVANLFLAKTKQVRDLGRVTTLELDSSQQKAEFYQKVASKGPAQINSYWTTLIFTGKGKPPKAFKEFQKLINELSTNPSAITYLPADRVTAKLKVVFTFP